MAQFLGVELVAGRRYRGRMVIHWAKWMSKGKVADKLSESFSNLVFYEPDALPADWPAAQRENVEDKWTAFVEGTFNGQGDPPAPHTSDYDIVGFWPMELPHKIPGGDDAKGGGAVPVVPRPSPEQIAALGVTPKGAGFALVASVAMAYFLVRKMIRGKR